MSIPRAILCILLPSLAVIDKGCGRSSKRNHNEARLIREQEK